MLSDIWIYLARIRYSFLWLTSQVNKSLIIIAVWPINPLHSQWLIPINKKCFSNIWKLWRAKDYVLCTIFLLAQLTNMITHILCPLATTNYDSLLSKAVSRLFFNVKYLVFICKLHNAVVFRHNKMWRPPFKNINLKATDMLIVSLY